MGRERRGRTTPSAWAEITRFPHSEITRKEELGWPVPLREGTVSVNAAAGLPSPALCSIRSVP